MKNYERSQSDAPGSSPGLKPPAVPDKGAAMVDVRALMAGRNQIVMLLDGEAYRLSITSRGKLILTK